MISKLPGHPAIALVESPAPLITDPQSALDLLATIKYETGCAQCIVEKSAITEEFFDLSTRLAGEVLQKFTNYHMQMAILGDFSAYPSTALRDFIRESNRGRHFFFVPTREEAVQKLEAATA